MDLCGHSRSFENTISVKTLLKGYRWAAIGYNDVGDIKMLLMTIRIVI